MVYLKSSLVKTKMNSTTLNSVHVVPVMLCLQHVTEIYAPFN